MYQNHKHHMPAPFLKLAYLGGVKANSRLFSILLAFLETDHYFFEISNKIVCRALKDKINCFQTQYVYKKCLQSRQIKL